MNHPADPAQSVKKKRNEAECMMLQSRRKSLRFSCKPRSVKIVTAYEEGEAVLVNISTDGCALSESTLQPALEETVLLSFILPEVDECVQVRAKVCRNEPQLAVQFTRIEPETESLIFKFFAAESRALKSTTSSL